MGTYLFFLPALYGDAFILKCGKGNDTFIMVIDSGPRMCQSIIVDEIKKLPKIDLLVLSHYDEDHISGFIEYFTEYPEDARKIKEIWCNCANQIEIKTDNNISAYGNAKNLSDLLREISSKDSELKWTELIKAGHEYITNLVSIHVLGPSEEALSLNWNKYIDEEYNISSRTTVVKSMDTSLIDLAEHETPKSKQIINNSSIALHIRTNEKSFLMLGDIKPKDVVKYLVDKGYSIEKPLEVDYVKVSHHGSKYNISNELLDIIKCNKYIISTNGGHGNTVHPDRETIAKILYNKQRNMNEPIHLYFNYKLSELEENDSVFITKDEINESNCIIHEEERVL